MVGNVGRAFCLRNCRSTSRIGWPQSMHDFGVISAFVSVNRRGSRRLPRPIGNASSLRSGTIVRYFRPFLARIIVNPIAATSATSFLSSKPFGSASRAASAQKVSTKATTAGASEPATSLTVASLSAWLAVCHSRRELIRFTCCGTGSGNGCRITPDWPSRVAPSLFPIPLQIPKHNTTVPTPRIVEMTVAFGESGFQALRSACVIGRPQPGHAFAAKASNLPQPGHGYNFSRLGFSATDDGGDGVFASTKSKAGTRTVSPHFLHFPARPAAESSTWILLPQCGQLKSIIRPAPRKKQERRTSTMPDAPAKGLRSTAPADAPYGARLKVLLLRIKGLAAQVGGLSGSSS
jgi:hypothetical protein